MIQVLHGTCHCVMIKDATELKILEIRTALMLPIHWCIDVQALFLFEQMNDPCQTLCLCCYCSVPQLNTPGFTHSIGWEECKRDHFLWPLRKTYLCFWRVVLLCKELMLAEDSPHVTMQLHNNVLMQPRCSCRSQCVVMLLKQGWAWCCSVLVVLV